MDVKILNNNLKFKYRVSAIFIYKDKVLVDKYGKDKFCLPGGYVEIGEISSDAMIRELKEEINLDFEILSFGGVIENFFTNIKSQKTHGIEFYYYVRLKNEKDYNLIDYDRVENDHGTIIHHHFKWIKINELNKFKLMPQEIIKYIQNREKGFHAIINELK